METEWKGWDNEIKNTLLEKGLIEKVEIFDSDPCWSVIENVYPFCCSSVDWTKHGFLFHSNMQPFENDRTIWHVKCNNFFAAVEVVYPAIEDTHVVIVGDGSAFYYGYKMDYATFKQCFEYFFEIPQHTYALIENWNKCFNYKFEGDLFFG